jgi:hypothetical protein
VTSPEVLEEWGLERAVLRAALPGVVGLECTFYNLLNNRTKHLRRRLYVAVAADVSEFLRERGGHFKDEPGILHEQLRSEVKPPRPDELSKGLKAIAARSPVLDFDAGNFKKNGQSRRFVELTLRNGVNGVNGVNHEKDEKPDSGIRTARPGTPTTPTRRSV